MTQIPFHVTPPNRDDIDRTAGLIRKARPAFGPLIDFYQALFTAQEESRKRTNLDPITIADDLLALKRENRMPLIDPSQFRIDIPRAVDLMKTICRLAADLAPKLAASAEILEKQIGEIDSNRLDINRLFSAILCTRQTELDDMAAGIGIPEDHLVFFAVSAMDPSLRNGAEQLAYYLADGPDFKKGYCPVCGSHPSVAFLDRDGKKFLVCSLCSLQWQTHRMGCCFCGSKDTLLQHYFFHEEEKEYRVYLCDNCQNYLKVIDLRQLDRLFIPKLEQVASLHLDMKAQEKGYTHATLGKNVPTQTP